jgi:hypothetical protein
MLRRLLLLLTLALPLAAQEQRISRIEVRGNVPASIVISQSALVEGRSYSTDDLEAGVARVRRLPFVYDARYVIDGETLRIEVTGMTPLFADVEAVSARHDSTTDNAALVAAGARHFLGSGVIEGSVNTLVGEGEDSRAAELQYAHYGLGGTRLFAIAGASFDLTDRDDSFEADPTWQLTLGYPLTVRQTISGSAYRSGSSSRTAFEIPVESSTDITGLRLDWTYDTTDDPYFARRGTFFEAGPSWLRFASEFAFRIVPPPPFEPISVRGREEDEVRSLAAAASHFRPVRSRGTLFGQVLASVSDRESEQRIDEEPPLTAEGESNAVSLAVGYGHNFFDRDAPLTNGRHRVEISALASRQHNESADFEATSDDVSLLVGYLFRARFARIGATFTYLFD